MKPKKKPRKLDSSKTRKKAKKRSKPDAMAPTQSGSGASKTPAAEVKDRQKSKKGKAKKPRKDKDDGGKHHFLFIALLNTAALASVASSFGVSVAALVAAVYSLLPLPVGGRIKNQIAAPFWDVVAAGSRWCRSVVSKV